MDGKSLDITAAILAQLKAMLPDVFSEDKIDFQRLKQALGEDVFVKGEHYELNWAGKTEARKEIQKQTTATLVPNRAESVDFDKANHIFIEGENLEVLRTLQKSYFGKVKMIYIDPPYNTGSDSFVYPDDYTERQDEYKKRTGISNEDGFLNKQDLWKKNVKENGQFHSVWLSMMYPRLYLSRNLLREDGVIFISIDDNEVTSLKSLMDEIFGEENFIGKIIVQSNKRGQTYKEIAKTHEYLLLYSKNDSYELFELEKEENGLPFEDERGKYDLWELRNRNPKFGRFNRPNLFYPIYVASNEIDEKGYAKISLTQSDVFNEIAYPRNSEGNDSCWRWGKDKVVKEKFNLVAKKTREGKWNIYEKARKATTKAKSLWTENSMISEQGTIELGKLGLGDYFEHPKPTDLIKKCLRIASTNNDLILDFFAGSGTTAQAVMELNEEDGGNRRFICVQMPEKIEEGSEAYKAGYKTIADITQARIKKVIEKLRTERKTKTEKEKGELFNGEDDTSQYPLGFQSYKLATSNFKQWNKQVTGEQALLEQLDIFQQAEIESSLPENMLYELLVKGGFDLTTTVEKLQINETTKIYNVDNGKLWVFFDKYTIDVKATIVAAKPERLIVLDSCFDGDDVAITNLQLDLRENSIDLTII
jgi:adenine-specific DNA-methyltransferase